MHTVTRAAFLAYSIHVATLNGVDSVAHKFNIAPDVAGKMEEKIKESSGFLGQINIEQVVKQSDRKLGLGANTPIAGRTNTDNKDRETKDPTGLDDEEYTCRQTNYDTHLKYSKLDAWRHRADFQILISTVISKQIARDRIMVGWNGTSHAQETNVVDNPLLQDVNIGWLEKIRLNAEEHHVDGLNIHADDEVKNIDAAVYQANREMTEEWTHNDTDKVVIVGSDLYTDKFGSLINEHGEPTEKLATDVLIANQRIGGLKAVQVPFFPANAFLITTLDNLSIYVQEETQRRHILDNPKRDRVEDYLSMNEAFVVENYDGVAFVENITTDAPEV